MANKINISVDADAAFYDAVDALCRADKKCEHARKAMESLFIVAHRTGLLDWSDTYIDEYDSYWMEFPMGRDSEAHERIVEHRYMEMHP